MVVQHPTLLAQARRASARRRRSAPRRGRARPSPRPSRSCGKMSSRPKPRKATTAAVHGPIPRCATSAAVSSAVGSASKRRLVDRPSRTARATARSATTLLMLKPSPRSSSGSAVNSVCGAGERVDREARVERDAVRRSARSPRRKIAPGGVDADLLVHDRVDARFPHGRVARRFHAGAPRDASGASHATPRAAR